MSWKTSATDSFTLPSYNTRARATRASARFNSANTPKGASTIEEESVDIRRYIGMLLAYWWLFLLLPIAGAVIGYYTSNSQAKVYEARAILLVEQRQSSQSTGASDYNLSLQLAQIYSRTVKSTLFLQRMISDHGLEVTPNGLNSMITVRIGESPPLLDIRVKHGNPDFAASIADKIAASFPNYEYERKLTVISRQVGSYDAQGLPTEQLLASFNATLDNMRLLDEVVVPTRPVLPQLRRSAMIGGLIGLVLAVAAALVLSSLGDTVNNAGDMKRRFGVNAIGAVFRWSVKYITTDDLIVWKYPSSGYAEAFRQIRANLQFATVKHPA